MKEICIQQKTGSCCGCSVLNDAISQARTATRDRAEQNVIAKKIGNRECPPGGVIFISENFRGRGGRLIAQ